MTLGPLKPFKRYGYKITLIQERVILYLRLLQLSENTVSALTKEILNRFLAVSENPPDRSIFRAFEILQEVLKEKNIELDERYSPIFSDAYRPTPKRTPMGYCEWDSKNTVFQNKKKITYFKASTNVIF